MGSVLTVENDYFTGGHFGFDSGVCPIIFSNNISAWPSLKKVGEKEYSLRFQIHQHNGENISKRDENILKQLEEVIFRL